ncbi:MAG TPA: polyhydroxyalkanoic acid system family protein [Anaeromyxobacteraceae bacterium]|nr:polyhydroxyalkanoic acid system family protein [Anaeromyxobacteraceae bacterium]
MHHRINRKYPGKSAGEIFEKVDEVMHRIAEKLSLQYEHDPAAKTGRVHKMGMTGTYAVRDEEVEVDIKFPMLVPGSMRKKVEENIHEKLDGLFA